MPVYQIAGFVVNSPVELPNLDLSLVAEQQAAHLTIVINQLPPLSAPTLSQAFASGSIHWYQQGFRLSHPEVGDMVIHHHDIYWQPTASVDIKGFRTFLVNTLLPAYAVLQGMLPLHISAVSVAGQVIAFQGNSGAGKSTLAAMLMKRGYPVVTEDLGIVELAEQNAIMRPGLPYFRLWKKSFKQLNETPNPQSQAWLRRSKFYRAIEGSEFCAQAQPIKAIYFLQQGEQGSDISIDKISGFNAANALLKSRFFGVGQQSSEQTKRAFTETMTLASQTQCYNLTRAKDFSQAEQVIDTLIAHWESH
ncbi:MAG: hypothetical protein RPS47_00140 [Colwellia sp.]